MNEFFYNLGWLIRFFELLIICFLILKFWKHRFSLFFGGKDSLKTIDDHELHSCFLTALCTLLFYFIGVETSAYIMSLPMEKFALRRVFYFSKLVIMASFMATLYILHSIRGCLFSRVAKSIGYLSMFSVSLHMMQLVARGYFDFNGLSPLYQFSVMFINVMAFMVIAIYSVKLMIKTKFDSYKELVK